MSTTQQPKLCQYSRAAQGLRRGIDAFESFSLCDHPASSSDAQNAFSMQQNKCMPTMLETCARLIRLQSQLASRNYQPVIDGLSQLATDAQVFISQMDRARPLPAGLVNHEDLTTWHNAVEAYKQASVSVNAWMVSYPELAPTLSQMLKWLPSPNVQQQIVSNSIESTDKWTSHVLSF